MDELEELNQDAPGRIDAAATIAELDDLEAETVGRRSPIGEARRGLGAIEDPAERGAAGKAINEVAVALTTRIAARRGALEVIEMNTMLEADRVDATLPGRVPKRGTHHLIQQTIDEIVDIFVGLGYQMVEGPEAESGFYNFTALNIPETHPSRHESDTFYLDYGDDEEEVLLRTHTSPMQARFMESHEPPAYIVVPGKVFRSDAIDSTHLPVFHQIEGLAVDDNITFGDLKGTLAEFARQYFGMDTKVKFIPHYFPFTEPSAELHAYTQDRWIELLGCGMVNPAVFEHVGYDPQALSGFAFGMGVERMAMVRHGITDLRTFVDPDVRTLEQFR
ncbi:MAG: phenylalanine--tRNA ligase subunit alpha [Acidimicrobiia bacterium]|nr:MAG: phenylalanine--tRNA ligase subunit alpha [Acidimicrobiia bacterium]